MIIKDALCNKNSETEITLYNCSTKYTTLFDIDSLANLIYKYGDWFITDMDIHEHGIDIYVYVE